MRTNAHPTPHRRQAVTTPTELARLAAMPAAIGNDIAGLGGFLRCETCKDVKALNGGDHGRYLARGWPKCCGHTMRWWTRRQIDAGEVPA